MSSPTVITSGSLPTTTDPPRISGFSYGIGISIGILLLITTIMLASYFCTRPDSQPSQSQRQRQRQQQQPQQPSADIESGLDDATIGMYPKVVYSQSVRDENCTTGTCCSICLADYRDDEVLRLLPDCKHMFHLKCVDPWLRLHPTCPVCRTSPLPSPLPTPLSELVPLARRQSSSATV